MTKKTKKDEMIAYWRQSAEADLPGDYFKRIKEFYQWLKVKIQLDES